MIENFQDLTASASACIKICASSRPWNCFKDAFGEDTDRKLYLQDLTREDIKLFAREKLADHAVSKGILQDKDFLYQELIEEIVERAHGVFLWVFLAVRSLREGIRNGDTASLLKKRLYSLPTELEPFFEHILNSVDGMYQERMACAFLVAFRAPKPLDVMQYSFLDEEDPEYAISLPFQRLSEAEIHFRVANTHRRINGRYRGLSEAARRNGELPHRTQIEFLHRTFRDFLRTSAMQSMLILRAPPHFNALAAINRALIADAKTTGHSFISGFTEILNLAKELHEETRSADHLLLDQVEIGCRRRHFAGLASSARNPFSHLLLELGLSTTSITGCRQQSQLTHMTITACFCDLSVVRYRKCQNLQSYPC